MIRKTKRNKRQVLSECCMPLKFLTRTTKPSCGLLTSSATHQVPHHTHYGGITSLGPYTSMAKLSTAPAFQPSSTELCPVLLPPTCVTLPKPLSLSECFPQLWNRDNCGPWRPSENPWPTVMSSLSWMTLLFTTIEYMVLCVYVFLIMHVCMWLHVHTCTHACGDQKSMCLLYLCTSFFESGALTAHDEACWFAIQADWWASGILLPLPD